jgi:hypothetical protein
MSHVTEYVVEFCEDYKRLDRAFSFDATAPGDELGGLPADEVLYIARQLIAASRRVAAAHEADQREQAKTQPTAALPSPKHLHGALSPGSRRKERAASSSLVLSEDALLPMNRDEIGVRRDRIAEWLDTER